MKWLRKQGQDQFDTNKKLEEFAGVLVHIVRRMERLTAGFESLVATIAATAAERKSQNSGPDIMRRLGRIELALSRITGDLDGMTKITDEALAKIEASITAHTTVVESVKAYIEANVTAQTELSAELEAQGVDVTKLNALNEAIRANTDRLSALTVKNTPAELRGPVPAPVVLP